MTYNLSRRARQQLRLTVSVFVLSIGCAKRIPPGPPVPHSGMPVAASFGKTWDAVIDVFAVKNIPVRTLERVSGLIAAEPANVEHFDPHKPHPWADCGSVPWRRPHKREFSQPSSAFYNVRVKGDSVASTILVTVRWRYASGKETSSIDCSTRGVWEADVEEVIRRRAEGDNAVFRSSVNQTRANPAPPNPPPSSATPAVARPGASATIGAPTSESARAEAVQAFARGKSYVGSHEWANAEASFREALQLDGSVAAYHGALGTLMMTLNRWDEAEAEFAAATLLDVDNPDYRRLLKSARSRR